MITKPKALVFDLFGTLVPGFSRSKDEKARYRMATELDISESMFNKAWSDSWDRRLLGDFKSIDENIEYVFRANGKHSDNKLISKAVEVRKAFTRDALNPKADAVEILQFLKRYRVKTGLISDCSMDVPHIWNETELAAFIDCAVFSCIVGASKPNPIVYESVCRRLAVAPGDCVYVADGQNDELNGARRIGMTAILIAVPTEDTYEIYRRAVEEWRGPVIENLFDLQSLIDWS